MDKYPEASVTKEQAIVTLGRGVYPLIKKTAGIPDDVLTPRDLY